MKVLMISGDKNILIPGSPVHTRLDLQRSQVEQLDVFVWPQIHSMFRIRAAALLGRYDVITAQDPFWRGHLAWHCTLGTRSKLNIQVHTDLSTEPWHRRFWARFHLRRADSVRVVSEKLRVQVQEMGITAPIYVLPVFVDIDEFKNIVPHPHTQKIILWIGRFEKEKDPLQAIVILKELLATGMDAKLVMLGAGNLEGELRRMAHDLPVEFPGWQDPKSYLAMADVAVCTSIYESYGASIIEVLAAGVPVIAPDVGIAKEAGAIVVSRVELGSTVIKVLQSGERGVLKLPLLTAAEWAKAWRETIVSTTP